MRASKRKKESMAEKRRTERGKVESRTRTPRHGETKCREKENVWGNTGKKVELRGHTSHVGVNELGVRSCNQPCNNLKSIYSPKKQLISKHS